MIGLRLPIACLGNDPARFASIGLQSKGLLQDCCFRIQMDIM
jgi:hypothetical protein